MRENRPPLAAAWMLAHLVPGKWNEALAGDLQEEFSGGRSAGWYWRQVFGAIAASCAQQVYHNRFAAFYAALWSMLAPASLVLTIKLETASPLFGRMWRMDWPWSTVCAIALSVMASLAFIWVGMAFYRLPAAAVARTLRLRRFAKGMLRGAFALIVVWSSMFAVELMLPPGPGHRPQRAHSAERHDRHAHVGHE
jgi:hypothetical protein